MIAYAAVCSYAEHILRYELLTWLDRAAAVSLAIVLVRRVGFIPRRCHLAVAALLWATCDSCTAICRGPCTCPSIRAASVEITQWTWEPKFPRRLWHVAIWTYVAELPRDNI